MAKKISGTLASVTEDTRLANNRVIGSGVVMPGEYEFEAADKVQVRYVTEALQNQDRSFTTVEIQAKDGRWVNIANLLKREKVDPKGDALMYINQWVCEYTNVWEIADALAGHTLTVSENRVKTYSNFRGGEQLEHPIENGIAYRATLS